MKTTASMRLSVSLQGIASQIEDALADADPVAMGNYLMKLASVTGVMMACAEGADTAFDRLLGTAQFVLKTMPKTPATLRPVQ